MAIGNKRRVGFADDNVALPRQLGKTSVDRPIKRQIIECAADQSATSEPGRGDAMHVHAVDDFLIRQGCPGIIVDLPRRDDVHLAAGIGQVKCEIGKNLAGGRMVGKEKPVDEDQSRHLLIAGGRDLQVRPLCSVRER